MRLGKKKKVAGIIETLEELYPDPPIPLKHSSSFTLLIAVLLSAQCTDERVNKVTPALFKKAKTPKAMAQVPLKELESLIRSCGLAPQKSKAISKLSKILLEKYGGRVPDTLEELESLPGVGRKTASVVLCQAFGKPAFPVDTHIHRLAERWGLSNGRSVVQTERDLRSLFPEEKWNILHLQMIYFGREYCPARGHEPGQCPICRVYGRRSMFV